MTIEPARMVQFINPAAVNPENEVRIEIFDLQPPNVSTGVRAFSVGGRSQTPSEKREGDASVEAKFQGTTICPRVPAIVHIPFAVKQPYLDPNPLIAAVTGKNVAGNRTSVPPFCDIRDPDLFRLVTLYGVDIPIGVLDQFGEKLNDIYNGEMVEELGCGEFRDIHQNINDGGYTDPVGVYFWNDPKNYDQDKIADKADIDAWLAPGSARVQARAVGPDDLIQNIPVHVAGHALHASMDESDLPGIKERHVELTPSPNDPFSAELKIIWPVTSP
jgi:hypothetical protein